MTGDTVGKVSEEYRKKRVRRIKRFIITFCLILLIVPTVLCIYLIAKVGSLEKRIDRMQESMTVVASGSATSVEDTTATATPEIFKEEPEEKKVYLTFEDSPSPKTEKILDILKKNNVKATFFVNGKDDDYSKSIYNRIVDEGHTLGMHSYSHVFDEIYASKEAFTTDLDKLDKLLFDVTGEHSKFYRFPGGSGVQGTKADMQDLIDILLKRNISYLDWNILSPDIKDASVTKKQMVNEIMKEVDLYETSVVAFYDSEAQPMTIKALPSVIKKLKEQGYEILPVDENTAPIRHNQ